MICIKLLGRHKHIAWENEAKARGLSKRIHFPNLKMINEYIRTLSGIHAAELPFHLNYAHLSGIGKAERKQTTW